MPSNRLSKIRSGQFQFVKIAFVIAPGRNHNIVSEVKIRLTIFICSSLHVNKGCVVGGGVFYFLYWLMTMKYNPGSWRDRVYV